MIVITNSCFKKLINDIDPTVLNNSDEMICKILPYKESKFSNSKNPNFLKSLISYILNTGRFTGPFLYEYPLLICWFVYLYIIDLQ